MLRCGPFVPPGCERAPSINLFYTHLSDAQLRCLGNLKRKLGDTREHMQSGNLEIRYQFRYQRGFVPLCLWIKEEFANPLKLRRGCVSLQAYLRGLMPSFFGLLKGKFEVVRVFKSTFAFFPLMC